MPGQGRAVSLGPRASEKTYNFHSFFPYKDVAISEQYDESSILGREFLGKHLFLSSAKLRSCVGGANKLEYY